MAPIDSPSASCMHVFKLLVFGFNEFLVEDLVFFSMNRCGICHS